MEYYRPVFDDLAKLESFDKIISIVETIEPHIPKNSQGYDILSYGYYKAKKYIKAAECGELALSICDTPEGKQALRFNLAKCYQYSNQPKKALNLLKINNRVNPKDIDSRIDYCVALYAQGNKPGAGKILREIQKEDLPEKNRTIVEFNLGMHDLREGKFKEGMQNLQKGRALTIWGSSTHNFPIPKWDGITKPGAKILIIGEGGIGDEFINCRFVKHFRDRGMVPSWASAHNLSSVMKHLPFEHVLDYKNFTSDIPTITDYDYWIPGMDLPAVLGVERDELWYGPYLKTDIGVVAGFPVDKLKIGIRWSGNPLYEQDLHRTIPLNVLIKTIRENVHGPYQLYSFQKENNEQLSEYPEIIDLGGRLNTFDHTLEYLDVMDIMISSCTSVAHASAALGKKTYIFTPLMAYYTWAEETVGSPWYGDKCKILRQTIPQSWDAPMEQLGGFLGEYK